MEVDFINYLQVFDGAGGAAVFLLHMLLQIVFPPGLEATERTPVGSGLGVGQEMSVQVVPANISAGSGPGLWLGVSLTSCVSCNDKYCS